MDSQPIAEKLEATYPEPSLHLETGLHDEALEITFELMWLIFPDVLHLLPKKILNEPSASWFAEDRKRRFGMTLDEMAELKGGEKAWPAVVQSMERLRQFLTVRKRDEGPFIMGSTPCYGDLCVVALFESLQTVSVEMYEKVVAFCREFGDLHEAGKKWARQMD